MIFPHHLRVSLYATLCAGLVACSSDDKKEDTSGDGGSGGNGSGGNPTDTPVECNGKPLPPRALDHSTSELDLEPYFPTTEWRTATASEAGMDQAKLDEALAFTTPQSKTQGILVLRGGYIVAEAYATGFTKDTRTESYSMAKSFSSALVGIAIGKGLLSGIDEKVCGFYPEWDCDDSSDTRSRIAVKHTMNVATGLKWHEDWRSSAGFADNDTILGGGNLLSYVLARPGLDEPGTVKRYSTGDPSLLSGVLQGATGKSPLAFAHDVLFDKIGISGVQWNQDPDGRTTTYAGLQATVREYGKFGFLYSRHGKWDGEQIVPGDWVDFTTRAEDACTEQYRYLWHINLPLRFGESDPACADFPACAISEFGNYPSDAFFAEGVQGQFIFIVPSLDLVVVRGASDVFGSEYWDEYGKTFLTKVLESVEK